MYDSREDTMNHIKRVRYYLKWVESNLSRRGFRHDQSKLEEPEKSKFDEMTPKLKGLTYGSDEYKASLKELGIALNHHYKHNSHHPEHFCIFTITPEGGEPQYAVEEELVKSGHGITSMSLLDIIEMLCDWKAASERHENGDIYRSIEQNAERFGYSEELKKILVNTAKEMGWK